MNNFIISYIVFLYYISTSYQKMVGSSILPVAIHDNTLYFLFGKENPFEDSAKGFSDFGGGMERNESRLDTALREGSEELSGFFGEPSHLRNIAKKSGGLLHLPFSLPNSEYHVHVFPMDYDPKLTEYFNHQHRFLWKRMNKYTLNASKLFEKQEIRWFSVEDLKQKRSLFRSFYREIVDGLLLEIPRIYDFVCHRSSRRPRHRSSRRPHHRNDRSCSVSSSCTTGSTSTSLLRRTRRRKGGA